MGTRVVILALVSNVFTALRLTRVLGLDWNLWHAIRDEKASEIADLEPLVEETSL